MYLERNISCDVHLLNELLETDVPWDDAIVVSAGRLRKLWDSLSELRSYVCERRLERTALRPALLPVKTVQFTQFFHQVWRHTVQISQLIWECIALCLTPTAIWRYVIIVHHKPCLSKVCSCLRPFFAKLDNLARCLEYKAHSVFAFETINVYGVGRRGEGSDFPHVDVSSRQPTVTTEIKHNTHSKA